MKYISKNKICDFEFHDAEFDFISFENGNLVISAKHLNIHRTSEENPKSKDMEIKKATLTFKNFYIKSIKKIEKYEKDEQGAYHPSEYFYLKGDEALHMLLSELKHGLTVYSLGVFEHDVYYLDGFGEDPYFTTFFRFDEVIVEWDEFLKPAWYELHKGLREKTLLATPTGDTEIELHINYNGEIEYSEMLKKQGVPKVTATLCYKGKDYRGCGNEYFWLDAIVDLQKKLPEEVMLKNCLTCRHGNFCPYGNEPGTVFCAKDLAVNSKEDVCDLFDREHKTIWTNRIKKYTDTCKDFEPQSEDHYTYNDYLYRLNK